MKNLILRAIILSAFAVVLTSAAQAQVQRYRAQVPFDFTIGSKHFAAGNYFLEVRGFERKIFTVRDATGKLSYSTVPSSSEELSEPVAEFIFRKNEGIYSLASIRAAALASTLPISETERDLARGKNSETISVAFSTPK